MKCPSAPAGDDEAEDDTHHDGASIRGMRLTFNRQYGVGSTELGIFIGSLRGS